MSDFNKLDVEKISELASRPVTVTTDVGSVTRPNPRAVIEIDQHLRRTSVAADPARALRVYQVTYIDKGV